MSRINFSSAEKCLVIVQSFKAKPPHQEKKCLELGKGCEDGMRLSHLNMATRVAVTMCTIRLPSLASAILSHPKVEVRPFSL